MGSTTAGRGGGTAMAAGTTGEPAAAGEAVAEADRKAAAKAWLARQTALAGGSALKLVAIGLTATVLAVVQVFCVAGVVAEVLAPDAASGRPRPIALLAAFAAAAVLRGVLGVIFERAAFDAGARARRRLRSDALSRLLHAGPTMLRRNHSADLAGIVVDRVEALDGLFSRWVPASVLAVLAPALVALVALWLDPVTGLILVGTGVLVPVGMAAAGFGAALAARRQFLALARLQARFVDRIRGIATIVLAGRVDDEARALAVAADELGRRTMRVLRVAFLSSAVLDLAFVAALAAIAIRYGLALRAGLITDPFGPLLAILLVPEFYAPLRAFAAAYQDRLHATGAAEAMLALPGASRPEAPREVRTVQAQSVSVAFEDVGLTWDAARGPALDGLSFRVTPGETLILVGPSGAGKSTVIEILLGFVRPDRGRVTINGADIAAIVPQALSRMTAWIGQRPLLFAGSIRDNIRFARPEATDAEIEDAARLARMSAFVADLPRGLDTPVGEGGHGLSGGQAQRVAIARAFLKNAPLLLLDEPTAHLDPATEADVLESLRRLALGRAVILATHSAAVHGFGGRRVDLRDGRAIGARGAA